MTPEVLTATGESVLPPPAPPLYQTKPQTTVQPDLELTKLKVKYEELLQKYILLKTSSNKKIKGLNEMVKYYKNRYYNRATSTGNKAQVAEKLLNMVLTKNQIDLLSCRKKLVHWTQEEISIAFTIRYYSKKCYLNFINYLLNYIAVAACRHYFVVSLPSMVLTQCKISTLFLIYLFLISIFNYIYRYTPICLINYYYSNIMFNLLSNIIFE